jgi:hypothetical protein
MTSWLFAEVSNQYRLPGICQPGMMADATIISETGRWKEEAGPLQGVAAKSR